MPEVPEKLSEINNYNRGIKLDNWKRRIWLINIKDDNWIFIMP